MPTNKKPKKRYQPRPVLADPIGFVVEDSEQAVGEYVEKYGETYRPQRLQAIHDTMTKARTAA